MTEIGKNDEHNASKLTCGIVMPISEIDGCSSDHWSDVKFILSEAIELAGFDPILVSDASDVGIIQKRIIRNLYENEIVVCDVSGKNPNVMFELGLRLAFDKPTIIVKDNKTSYSFDTSPIEHLEYPRELRFNKIVEFKEELAYKIKATHKKSIEDPNYTTFLKHFGDFKTVQIQSTAVSKDEYVLDELKNLTKAVIELQTNQSNNALYKNQSSTVKGKSRHLCLRGYSQEIVDKVANDLLISGFSNFSIEPKPGANHFHIYFDTLGMARSNEILAITKKSAPTARFLP